MTDTPIPDFPQINRREDRLYRLVGGLVAVVVLLAALSGFLVLRVQATARDTKQAVVLLEGRTPLFGQLQATEERIECIVALDAELSRGIADGLVAVVAEDDVALAEAAESVADARAALILLGTPDDPCLRG